MKSALSTPPDPPVTRQIRFLVTAALWVVALFAAARIPWIQQHLLLPFAALQGRIGCGIFGTPVDSVFVGLSCTGADPIALVAGGILAFPVRWSQKVGGCLAGLALIIALNTLRIGTLSLVVDRTETFSLLHYYVWPGLLIAVAAGYVFYWMAAAQRVETEPPADGARLRPGAPILRRDSIRFALLLILLLSGFYLASGMLFRSQAVLQIAGWAANSAAAVMATLGVSAKVAGSTLQTPNGSFLVTQSCVLTPLLPVYLAAALSLPTSPTRKALSVLAAAPLFFFLAMARLLVLALPIAIAGWHNVAIHAFYQVLAALLVVVWAHRPRKSVPLGALTAGVGVALITGAVARTVGFWARGLSDSTHLGHGYVDGQGALALMPAFQFGLLAALWIARRTPWAPARLASAVGILTLAQTAAAIVVGELVTHAELPPPILVIRAFSLALPIALVWLLSRRSPATDRRVEPTREGDDILPAGRQTDPRVRA